MIDELASQSAKSKGKILIIDNDLPFANNLKLFLENNKYKVITSSSGSNGIYNAIVNKPDLILAEVSLPDIDGFTIKQELNRLKPLINSHFIFTSKYSSTYFTHEALELGADGFLMKPLKYEELIDMIESKFFKNKNVMGYLERAKPMAFDSQSLHMHSGDATTKEKKETPAGKHALNINRRQLNDYEIFNFNDLTLIIVNLTVGNQKEAVAFRDFLFPIIALKTKKILIDLSQLEQMDSAFTGVLVEASKKFKMYGGGEIKLVLNSDHESLNPFVFDWIQKNFTTYEDLNFAINCVSKNTVYAENTVY